MPISRILAINLTLWASITAQPLTLVEDHFTHPRGPMPAEDALAAGGWASNPNVQLTSST